MHSSIQPIVLTIAGNDTAGLAGLASDLKTQQVFGVHSMAAITAVTAQNDQQVISLNAIDVIALKEQLEAVKEFPIAMVKVGLVCNIEQARVIANFIETSKLPMVLDPVLASSSGFEFIKSSDIAAYVDLLLPLSTLVTPNLNETSLLTNLSVETSEQIELAAESMLLMGAQNVLIKGGHTKSRLCQDYFASEEDNFWLTSKKNLKRNTRGTGCVLASSIASALALGYPIKDALVIGKMTINQGIKAGYSVGDTKGPLAIKHFPNQGCDLPLCTATPEVNFNRPAFSNCNETPLGLYPVVDNAEWLEHLLPLGVTTIQLRVKDLKGDKLRAEIAQAITIAREYQCRLFINDHWQLAIELGAYGVHLGQEDLQTADIDAIQAAGLRLGLSTHCHYEVAQALVYKPSYIACGPVYHTNSKQMPWIPHGIEGLSYWRKVLDYPLVAIGGINAQRIAAIAATGVDGVAMISAITEADDPQEVTEQFIKIIAAQGVKKA